MAIRIFTDGASSGNPGPGGWGAIIITEDSKVEEFGGREDSTTNNRMEMTAAIRALEKIKKIPGPVEIATDSSYLIQGIEKWVKSWSKNGWKTSEGKPVANVELWKELLFLVQERGNGKIKWVYLPGHSGIPANERTDEIAVAFSKGQSPKFFSGFLRNYPIDVNDTTRKTNPKAPALFYVSLVDGVPMRHTSWADCEVRVKGRAGAKYRKVTHDGEEAEILKSWGIPPTALK